ncbi:MAG: hypothetical protein EPO24_01215, partial [Bacteroidetes bacterium]
MKKRIVLFLLTIVILGNDRLIAQEVIEQSIVYSGDGFLARSDWEIASYAIDHALLNGKFINGFHWLWTISLTLYDASTKQIIPSSEGVVIDFTFIVCRAQIVEAHREESWFDVQTLKSYYNTRYTVKFMKIKQESQSVLYNDSEITLCSTPDYIPEENCASNVPNIIPPHTKSVVISIRARNYEDERQEIISDEDWWNKRHLDVYLTPKNKDVKLSGEIMTRVKEEGALTILNSAQVALKLGIAEKEVIELIEKKQLKGKKI